MKIVLASASPRRREILSMVCDSFDIRVSNADESYSSDTPLDENKEYSEKLQALTESLELYYEKGFSDTPCLC